MNPRTRRLYADSDLLRTEFAGHPIVTVEPTGFDPPEAYRVTYQLLSASLDTEGQPVISDKHVVHIQLPAGYPRVKPYCTSESVIFHPNFDGAAGGEICVGDYWTPAQSLVDLVVQIGEMLQFQSYNVRSPLNALAAQWVAENEHVFPLGHTQLFQSEPSVQLGASGVQDDAAESPSDVEHPDSLIEQIPTAPHAEPSTEAVTSVSDGPEPIPSDEREDQPLVGVGVAVGASDTSGYAAGKEATSTRVEVVLEEVLVESDDVLVDLSEPRGLPMSPNADWWQASDGLFYHPRFR